MANLKEEHKLFPWSQPVGYSFNAVEETIHEYQDTIRDAYELIDKKDDIIRNLKAKIDHLERQVTDMEINMRALDVKPESEESSYEILRDFASSNAGSSFEIPDDEDTIPDNKESEGEDKSINNNQQSKKPIIII